MVLHLVAFFRPRVPGLEDLWFHYIEVAAGSVDSEEEERDSGSINSEEESTQVEEKPPRIPPTPVGAHPPIVSQPPK
jgi:hypothetical protein